MLTKNRKKLIKSLQQKKYRDAHGLFLVEGEKMVKEALSSNISAVGFEVESVYALLSLEDQFPSATIISDEDMQSITALKNHSGVLAVIKQSTQDAEFWNSLHANVLVLDDIKDPGNLGTIIRSAEWFGIKEIIVSPYTVEWYNPKAVQSTMGSIFRVKLRKESLTDALPKLHDNGYTSYAADMGGTSIQKVNWASKKALIVGSEAHGLSDEVKELAQHKVHIEGKGNAESLNAGVATAIILSHWS
ncbi:MAG: TrmH family RNA methyltransferase [Flavobacteriales bacterium]